MKLVPQSSLTVKISSFASAAMKGHSLLRTSMITQLQVLGNMFCRVCGSAFILCGSAFLLCRSAFILCGSAFLLCRYAFILCGSAFRIPKLGILLKFAKNLCKMNSFLCHFDRFQLLFCLKKVDVPVKK